MKGGTSVNSIASSASLLLDLRSEDAEELDRQIEIVKNIVNNRRMKASREGRDLIIHIEQVGDRPAGLIPRDDPLIQWAESALSYVGCSPITYIAGSTDANIPLSQGMRSVCIGLTYSGKSHRTDEYIEPASLTLGMQQLLLLTLATTGF